MRNSLLFKVIGKAQKISSYSEATSTKTLLPGSVEIKFITATNNNWNLTSGETVDFNLPRLATPVRGLEKLFTQSPADLSQIDYTVIHSFNKSTEQPTESLKLGSYAGKKARPCSFSKLSLSPCLGKEGTISL